MKAISLQLKAFGPYSEEQNIQFEELRNESIFLITGPTGAGKTTIFDAICYALYGKASGNDREQDSLKSHFAGEEVQTEVRYTFGLKDKQYMVVRAPRQLKKKARGEGFTEEPARAELYEWKEDHFSLLSAKVKDVNDLLESRLGLDYEQFRKMVMIPQGEFRRLISENSKEREEILQKIFRTYFYEQITEEFKKQAKELKSGIQDLEWKIEQEQSKIEWSHTAPESGDGFNQITEKLHEEIKSTIRLKEEKETELIRAKKIYKEKQEDYFAGKQLFEKFEEWNELTRSAGELASKKEEMETVNDRLEQANRSEKVRPYQEQAAKRKTEWEAASQRLKNQETETKEIEKDYQQASIAYEEEKEKEAEREKIKTDIEAKKNQLKAVQAFNLLRKKTNEAEQYKQKLEQKIKATREVIQRDTERIAVIDDQRDKRERLTKAYYETAEDEKQKSDSLDKIKRFAKELDVLQQKREAFLRIQANYKQVREKTEQAVKKVSSLEEDNRKNHALLLAESLKEGDACPVCGSTHHPDPAVGTSASVSEEELNHWIDQKDKLEATLQLHSEEFYAVQSDGKYQRQRVDQLAEEAGIEQAQQQEWQSVYKAKEEQLKQAEKNKKEITAKLKELDRLTDERKLLQKQLDQTSKELEDFNRQKEAADAEWNRSVAKLEELQKEIPEHMENEESLQGKVTAAEKRQQEMTQKWEIVQQRLQHIKEKHQQAITIQNQLQQFESASKEKFENEQTIFFEKQKEEKFSSIEDYQAALMEKTDKDRLEQLINEYNQQKEAIQSRLDEVTKQLKDRSKPDLNTLGTELDDQEKTVQAINDGIQGLLLYIKQHEQIASNLQKLTTHYEEAGQQYFDIGELADLAKGENHLRLSFERYVLASFLDEILLQANIRLDQMTEHRYQLFRSDQIAKRGAQSGLDLEILDHHTGQKRSVKTLSGGEGFKAALSLALGMSEVVQAHAGGVQLETLFIDEGFGTLDELSLEQAIDCLKGLQQGNRVLGIISHVPQLKEEIKAKLQVTLTEKGSRAAFVFH